MATKRYDLCDEDDNLCCECCGSIIATAEQIKTYGDRSERFESTICTGAEILTVCAECKEDEDSPLP